jgi:hypothetical protein
MPQYTHQPNTTPPTTLKRSGPRFRHHSPRSEPVAPPRTSTRYSRVHPLVLGNLDPPQAFSSSRTPVRRLSAHRARAGGSISARYPPRRIRQSRCPILFAICLI